VEKSYLPTNVQLKEPWKMRLDDLRNMHKHWLERQKQGLPTFRFKSVVPSDQRPPNAFIKARKEKQSATALAGTSAVKHAESSAMGAQRPKGTHTVSSKSNRRQVKQKTVAKKTSNRDRQPLSSKKGKGKEKMTYSEDDDSDSSWSSASPDDDSSPDEAHGGNGEDLLQQRERDKDRHRGQEGNAWQAQERAERERVQRERVERERIARVKAEVEREMEERRKVERERKERERVEQETAERERQKVEREKVEREKAERERAELERIEQARVERDMAEHLLEQEQAAARRSGRSHGGRNPKRTDRLKLFHCNCGLCSSPNTYTAVTNLCEDLHGISRPNCFIMVNCPVLACI
jgi:hypothetical protein